MKCPGCKTEELDFSPLESNLTSRHCDKCGGNWIPSFEYWKWRDQHKEGPPETAMERTSAPNPVTDALIAKLCPECNKILIKYRVGHGARFSLDHNDIYLIFTAPWQDQVRGQDSRRVKEEIYRMKFGDEDFNEIQRMKVWIEGHSRKQEILAYLMSA
jgi:hypothetical protein